METELRTPVEPGIQKLVEGPATTRPLRLGVLGLGAVAQAVHLPLLLKRSDLFAPTAICDLSGSARERVGDRLGIPAERRFAAAEELLAADGLDAVAVITSGSHGELTAAAARAGLAVFCEKPLAYTVGEADVLAALEPRLLLGYMKLYDPAVERARELLAGRPPARSVEVTVLHPSSASQLAHAGLLPPAGDVEPASVERLAELEAAAVGQALGEVPAGLAYLYAEVLLGSVVHDLAVIRYLLGGPLTFDFGDAWPDGGAESVALSGRLEGGARVSIRWHYLERYPAYREEVRVHDEQGTVSLAFPAPYLLHAPTVLTVVDDGGAGAEQVTELRSTVEAFERQWLAFAALATEGAPPRAGVAEGREDIVACQGAAAVLGERQGIAVGGEAAGAEVARQQ